MNRLTDQTQATLQNEFHGRIRLRWSHERGCFLAEQREAEAIEPGFIKVNDGNDEQIQARDGFSPLFEVWAGSKCRCWECGSDVPIIPGKVKVYECLFCKVLGKTIRMNVAGFYPDSEGLIQELRKLDYIGHNAADPRARVRAHVEKQLYQTDRKDWNIADDRQHYTRENWRWLTGTPRTGYRGATPFWER